MRDLRNPRAVVLAIVAALAASLTACGTDRAPAHVTFGNVSPASNGAPLASPSAAPPPVSTGTVTLEFAGDVQFAGQAQALLDAPATTFGPISSVLSAADVTTLDLETAVTNGGTPEPKALHFRAPLTVFPALAAAGVDAVSLANNHAMDYGRSGLSNTLTAAGAAGFPVFGAGKDATAAWKPWTVTVRGTRIAYIGISDVQQLSAGWIATPGRSGMAISNDLSRTLAAVREAKKSADVVIVVMHWGVEGATCPAWDQTTLAAKLAGAGATMIIGSHTHTLQADGWLGSTFVAYSLGNFLWGNAAQADDTGVLRVTLHTTPAGRLDQAAPLSATLIPAVLSPTGQPIAATGADKTHITSAYASLRGCSGLRTSPRA